VPHQKGIKPVAQNRKAFHDYFVEERYECGVALFGTEVKSSAPGRINLKESWAVPSVRARCGLKHAHQPLTSRATSSTVTRSAPRNS
jgi:tmRNA-binding protein